MVMILCLSAAAYAGNGLVPGELRVEPSTLHCLGFEWSVQGDDNRNGSATVRYRKVGDAEWRTGLPLLALGHEFAAGEVRPEYAVPRMFAGSIFDLTPGTEYEVELSLQDPDGGKATRMVKARTKDAPKMFEAGKRLHVYPADFEGHDGQKETPAFGDLNAAFKAAQPGDQILVHAGRYVGSYVWKKGGQAGKHIAIRSAGDGEVILVNNQAQSMFDIHRCNYLWFEGLTFRDPGTGDGGHTVDGVVLLCGNRGHKISPGCRGLVVRRCKFEDFGVAIMAADGDCAGFVITDNRFHGRQDWLGPHKPPKGGPYDKFSWTAIWISGQGHDIGYNFVRGFRDGINLAVGWSGGAFKGKDPNASIDIYNNDITQTEDDFLETDSGTHNIRVLRNRCTNSKVCGLSAQPVYGGPVYFIRNTIYNVSAGYGIGRQIPFKLEVNPAGVLIYHNTAIAGQIDSRFWSNGHFRNNVFLGNGQKILDTRTHTPHSSMDYDGFGTGTIRWCGPQTGMKFQTFPTLAAFAKATGLEQHGVLLGYDIFASQPELPFGKKKTYQPGVADLRLEPGGAAVDAGCVLPNINDGFTGEAPDLGAYELGRPIPHYGPRAR